MGAPQSRSRRTDLRSDLRRVDVDGLTAGTRAFPTTVSAYRVAHWGRERSLYIPYAVR